MSTPLFRAAGLEPKSINIHIVNNKDLNAFVADGLKMFIHTGLLMRSESPEQLIGVIAHETGHIAGGHLSRFGRVADRSGATALIAGLIGGAAAIGTGRGDIGGAIAAGGQHLALREFLTFSRTQEASADQAALRFLDNTGQSAAGLLTFLKLLSDQELLVTESQDPYVRTHPLTTDRIETIEAHLRSPNAGKHRATPEMKAAFDRMQAKLIGYFEQPQLTLRKFPATNTSIPARYARAFAYAKIPNVPQALANVDSLLKDLPNDPYFLELKAQILFENARVPESIPPLRRATEILPEEPLLRMELGRILIESQEPGALDDAVKQLEFALSRDKNLASAWRYLGIAYGRKGDMGRSSLALAEGALMRGDESQARFHAGRALTIFPRGSREWLHAEDIQLAAKKKDQ